MIPSQPDEPPNAAAPPPEPLSVSAPDRAPIPFSAHPPLEPPPTQVGSAESERRARLIIEHSWDIVFMLRPDMTISYASPSVQRHLGYAPEELIHRPAQELAHPEEIQPLSHSLAHWPDQPEQSLTFECRVRHKDGSWRWLELVANSLLDEPGIHALVFNCREITERKLALDELRASQEYARSLVDCSLDMIIAVDLERRITEFNPAAEAAFGYRREEVLGRVVGLLYADPDMGQAISQMTLTQRHTLRQVLNRRKNGEVFPCLLAASVLQDTEGRPFGLMGVSRDITEQKQVEETLRRYAEEQATLYETALRLNRQSTMSDLLHVIVEQAVGLLHAESGLIYEYEPDRNGLRCLTGVGAAPERVGEILKPGEGLVGRAFESGAPQTGDAWSVSSGQEGQPGAILVVPLVGSQRAIGVLVIENRQPGFSFRERDVRLAGLFAAQAAIAIENARLFQAEHEQRELAQALHEIGSQLTATLDSQAVLDSILSQVGRLVPHDAANLMLVEDGLARIVRSRGYEQLGLRDPDRITFDIETMSLFRDMMTSGQPVVVADSRLTPGWVVIPDTAWVRSFVGVPIRVRNQTIGFLNVDSRTPNFFHASHAVRLQALANQAAIALANADVFGKARVAADRLQALSHHLVQAQEMERTRIARELHDEIGQALTSQRVDLHFVEQHIEQKEVAVARLHELKESTGRVLENLHRLTVNLRPVALDHLGLVAALEQYVQSFRLQHPHVDTQFQVMGMDSERQPDETETALYRIVQESLTNVARHAQATQVQVLLARRGDRIILMVWDNGVGFDPRSAFQTNRLGLTGMRERASMLQGQLWVESSHAVGTTVHVEIPYVHSNPDRG